MSNSKTFTAQVFKWMAQVNRDKILASAKNIAMALAPYFNEEEESGAAWPSLDTIAGDAGMSKANVIKLVRMLEARGHLKVKWGSQGSGNSNNYWMQKRSPQSDLSEGQKRSPQSDLSEGQKRSPQSDLSEQEKGHVGAEERSLQSEKRSQASDLNLLKPSKEPSKQQPRAREEVGEKEGQASKYSLDVIEHACSRAAGLGTEDYRTNIEAIAALLGAGFDLEEDLLPVIVARKGIRFTSWLYFVDAIKDAKAKRQDSGPHARTGNGADPAAKPPPVGEERWRIMWNYWLRNPSGWPIVWGPDPTSSYGCEIPKHLIEKWTAEHKAEKEKAS